MLSMPKFKSGQTRCCATCLRFSQIAFAVMAAELWSARRIAQEYGWAPATARSFIRRYGLKNVTTEGPRDARLYNADEVRAAKARMPGRGNSMPRG